jgi:hypothetical protein
MKTIKLLLLFLLPIAGFAQQLPRGTVFGAKPDTTAMLNATGLEAFMDKKPRITTTIHGRVIKVTHTKGGWFEIDAGKGKIIAAHFKDYNVTIPSGLAGKEIIADGVAEKQFIADDLQHYAGDTATGKKQHNVNANPKRALTFEVKGMMVK